MSVAAFDICEWVEIPGQPGYYDCLHCKLPLGHPRGQRGPREYPAKVRRECRPAGSATTPVPVVHSNPVKRYLSAREKWIAAGRPMRIAEERATLFAICQSCEHYQPLPAVEGGRCKVCKCGIAQERDTLNKIAWGTEVCPLGHWS